MIKKQPQSLYDDDAPPHSVREYQFFFLILILLSFVRRFLPRIYLNMRLGKLCGQCFDICISIITNTVRSLIAVIAVIITFLPFSAFMGIRYCCRRHRNPNQQQQQQQQNRAQVIRNYRGSSRKKKPKLMSIEQVDESFPITTFKNATTELDEQRQRLNDNSNDEANNDSYEMKEYTTPTDGDNTESSFNNGPDLEEQNHVSDTDDEDKISNTHDDVVPFDPVDSDDTCAICIETMDDMDSVRLLTCGHIFHSECIDPWLTVRRACCPLCKADYYVPKPADENDEQGQGQQQGQQNNNQPTSILNTVRGFFNRDQQQNNHDDGDNNISGESEAVSRRRRAAIYNIWGRRHGTPERAHVRVNTYPSPAAATSAV